MPSPVKAPGGGVAAAAAQGEQVIFHELTRLRNELRLKDSQMEEMMVEIQTLKNNIYKKDEALEKADKDLSAMKEKVTTAESELLSLRRQLATTAAERDQLRREAEAATRQADSLNEKLLHQVSKGHDDGGAQAEDVVRLTNLLHELKLENAQLQEDNKGCYNVIRAKDQELDDLSSRVTRSIEQALVDVKSKENIIADLRRQLNESRAELQDSQQLQRLRTQEVTDVKNELERTEKELRTTSEYLSGVMAELAVAQDNLRDSRVEVKDLRDQLMRAGLAAARAKSELASPRDGSVSVMQHLEEVKYMQGEIFRLKQRLQHAEAESKAAQAQRERLFRRIDSLASSNSGALAAAQRLSAAAGSAGGDAAGSASAAAGDEEQELTFDSPDALIAALRAELSEAREAVAMREEEIQTLGKQSDTSARRAARFRLDAQRLKHKLYQTMGPAAYAAEFGEAQPPAIDEAAAQELASEEAEAAREAGAAAQARLALERALAQLARREQDVAALQQQVGAAVAAGFLPASAAAEDVTTERGTEGPGSQSAEAAAEASAAGGLPAWVVAAGTASGTEEPDSAAPAAASTAGLQTPGGSESLAAAAGAAVAGAAAGAAAAAAGGLAAAGHAREANSEEDAASLRFAAEAIGQKSLELASAQEKVGELQRRVRDLEAHVADLEQQLEEANESEGSDEEDDEEDSGLGTAQVSPLMQATLDSAEARRRNQARQQGSILFGSERDDPLSAPMTKDRLATVLERLVQQREASKRAPKGSAESKDDKQLFDEATAMLKAELARLGAETVKKMEENEKLRSEVGELKTARFTAEAMATRLEEMNALSMQVAGLKMELTRARAVIDELSRKKKKKRNPMRKLRKTFSQATEGISKGLQSFMHEPEASAEAGSGRPVQPNPHVTAQRATPFGGTVAQAPPSVPEGREKKSWGDRLKSLTPRRSSSKEDGV